MQKGLPTVKYCAWENCAFLPNYFGDLIKKETGKTALEYIQNKIMDMPKEKLLVSSNSISQIAYSLGFQYPQHFTRVFKKLTGCTLMNTGLSDNSHFNEGYQFTHTAVR